MTNIQVFQRRPCGTVCRTPLLSHACHMPINSIEMYYPQIITSAVSLTAKPKIRGRSAVSPVGAHY
jgi:hypothetical protein